MARRSSSHRSLIALATALLGGVAVSAPARAADPAHPVVVELFQSQGCSSCPPANENLLAIADRPDVLALSWQVTYRDDLGWKDTFGSPVFTARQWDYAHALHRNQVATPEVVINGRTDVVGNQRGELEAAIRRSDRGVGGPAVEITGDKATVSGAAKGVVILVRYDPNILQVPIRRGENGGRTLPHKNVVREVARLGDWTGGSHTFALPPATRPGLKTAVLVQAGVGGPIIAAARG